MFENHTKQTIYV